MSAGDGIYKSTDAGETWTRMGLPESERIVRILVSPRDSNVVYACVPGKLWSDSPDRGVYKTTDGGSHWSLILRGRNLSTGCSGLTMDPKNPERPDRRDVGLPPQGLDVPVGRRGPGHAVGQRHVLHR